MTLFFNALQEEHLGYAAVFLCMALGFLFIRTVERGQAGSCLWALSFLLNSLGFLLWSGKIPLAPLQYYILGDLFHVSGFFLLVWGAYRFTGHAYKAWNLAVLALWALAWIGPILFRENNTFLASLLLKSLRAGLFVWAGIMILRSRSNTATAGRRLAGWSLMLWGAYILVFAFLRVESMLSLIYGFLVGFQLLASFGMLAMMIERVRLRAEESETQVQRLEGLLPICSYCKNIRDENQAWHPLEIYIQERSGAEFTHGICPECLKKHHPEYRPGS